MAGKGGGGWGDLQPVVEWVLRLGPESLPAEPWVLTVSASQRIGQSTFFGGPFLRVVNNAAFLAALCCDLNMGPDGPRARTGALQEDVLALARHFTGM